MKPQTKPLTAILLLSIISIISMAPVATAQDIYVNTTGWWHQSGAFNASSTPIQHAIDNAIAGETICVKDGAYTDNVNVNKRLTIHSENGSANCVVQAPFPYNVFDVTASYVNISGLMITGAYSGIYIASGAHHCNISFNNVSDNFFYGIYAEYSDHNLLLSNLAHSNFYGIYLTQADGTTLMNNTANYNTFQGIHLNHSTNTRLTENRVSDNTYGIYLSHTSNNTITKNTANANTFQGIHLNHSTDSLLANNSACGNNIYGIYVEVDMENTTIRDNNASGNTYGIYLTETNNNTITNNNASANADQGIHLNHSTNSRLTKNHASGNTYGIYLSITSNNTITNNNANSNTLQGIHLDYTNDSRLADNIANSNNDGIYLDHLDNNSLTNNTVNSNNNAGFRLTFSHNNTFNVNSAYNNTNYDFHSDEYAHNNEIEDFFLISSYPTTVSFTYDNGIGVASVDSPHPDPGGWQNISKYVDVTNVTASSWLFLNVSYSDGDLADVTENTLIFHHWLGGAWTQIPGSGVNTLENYVYGNITSFSQVAPFGRASPPAEPPTPPPAEVPAITPPGFLLALVSLVGLGAVVIGKDARWK